MKKSWREIESRAWAELADEGDVGEVRFNQRVRLLAEEAGYPAEEIQTNFKRSAERMEKAARLGYTAANPMPDEED